MMLQHLQLVLTIRHVRKKIPAIFNWASRDFRHKGGMIPSTLNLAESCLCQQDVLIIRYGALTKRPQLGILCHAQPGSDSHH
eukprot:5157235-Amphidinium_carterae.1